MSNAIVDNPFVSQLFDVKERNPNTKPGLEISELAKAKAHADQLAKQANSADALFEPSQQSIVAAARMEQAERAYQYSEIMNLQLTTKEGDKVSVDFRQLYAEYQSYKEMQSEEKGPEGVRYFESKEALEMTRFEERFAFSVEGDLNEDELKAVFDVFEQVDDLSNQFFDGNIEKALQQAMELDIDFGQLSSFKLDLTQTETIATRYQQAALAEYDNVQQQSAVTDDQESLEEYGVDISDLPPYLQNWQEALNRLEEQFADAQQFLDEIVSGVTSQRFPEQDSQQGWLERVSEFHEKLAEMAQMNSKESPEVAATENSVEALPEANNPNSTVV